jgi:hypothetical protein
MKAQWREASKNGSRFLCIFEICQNCHEHAMTTKHDPKLYSGYRNTARDWIREAFPFISFAPLRYAQTSEEHPLRRVGSFEIYLLCPSDKGCFNSSSNLLLHSKLMTRRWPVQEALITRVRDALPDIVKRVEALQQQEWNERDVERTIKEAEDWGLGSWAPVAELGGRIRKVQSCLVQGQRACESGDKEALRDALLQGKDLHVADKTVNCWRENLKTSNMVMFNIKQHAHRFRKNAEYFVAIRLVESARSPPRKLEILRQAVSKARSADMAEEDFEDVVALLGTVSEVVAALDSSMRVNDLDGMAGAIDQATAISLADKSLSSLAAVLTATSI